GLVRLDFQRVARLARRPAREVAIRKDSKEGGRRKQPDTSCQYEQDLHGRPLPDQQQHPDKAEGCPSAVAGGKARRLDRRARVFRQPLARATARLAITTTRLARYSAEAWMSLISPSAEIVLPS